MPAINTVRDLANVLEINEYEVFRSAYRRCYGHRANPLQLERDFHKYVFQRDYVPAYLSPYVGRNYIMRA